MQTKFSVTGVEGTLQAFENLREQIGDSRKSSKILTDSVKEAMKPVLMMAKMLVPKDTGALGNSLGITSRRPTRKDMKSNYVKPTDSAIALVSTKPIPARLRKTFAATGAYKLGKKEFSKAQRKFYKEQGSFYDARAISTEYGTAKMPAKPYLRISLESQQMSVIELLGMILHRNIENYAKKLKTQQKGK